jgi:hypothetical protein
MRKATITLLASIALVGCGTTGTTAIQEETPVATLPPVTVPTVVDKEQNFLNGLTYDHPAEVSRLGKASVLELGRLTCEAIDEGSTIGDFVKMAGNTGASPEFIGSLIREAVENFCPENQWFIDSALNA